MEQVEAARPTVLARVLEALSQVFARSGEQSPELDLDEVPDRVKRDIGFLDGREPRYEDSRLR
ncbi:hypothetical protein GGD46_001470 [Rhizobium lusitanum]|uniref:Uncharacterized protein n=1 Tax=Rhizobium lusitanum TaxID=293958 RepID=A0A7X0INF8_9HYPH|nr:hypothetical protein [Rhizobium lusitanum]